MKVAFWSNVRGKSCVTSNLACISVLSALAAPGEGRTILLENHQNILNLGSVLFDQSSGQEVREKGRYEVACGFSRLLCLMQQNKEVPDDAIYHYTREFLGNRLLYLPLEGIRNSDVFEYQLERECIRTMMYLEQKINLVMMDISAAPTPSSRKILQESDLVVVNLTQNRQMMTHFFQNYSEIQKKAFYLISNYEEDSDLSKAAVVSRYQIPGNQIGTIPHSRYFADAVSEGKLIPFLLKNYDCVPDDPNYGFIRAARESAHLFLSKLDDLQMRKHD